jgi:hypothetical protein
MVKTSLAEGMAISVLNTAAMISLNGIAGQRDN